MVFSLKGSSQKISKSIQLDSSIYKMENLSIVPNSININLDNTPVSDSLYVIDYVNSTLIWKGDLPVNLQVNYVIFPFDFNKKYSHKDTSLIQPLFDYKNPFRSNGKYQKESSLFGLDELNKSGSISRGISVGNAQDLGVNSNFNLQLSGKINGDIDLLASITDNNIPIQPDGNTQQLQDFDKVFIQLSEKKWKLIAGDYANETTNSHYLRYRKKSNGLFFGNSFLSKDSNMFSANAGVAISRGKYATKFFNGVEGNQGPYKLTGAENELFILVLSGTEQVFVDGNLLKRGAEKDYIIDYNTAEIIFTPHFLITKNKRIEVQFQYSDQNYLRTLAHSEISFENKNSSSYLRFYSEQDHKNQPLFQDLGDNEKALMASVGNNINNAFISRENLVEGDENVVSYEKKDSLGTAIYVYSTEKDSSLYRVQFSNVGQGNGNYVEAGVSPFGKFYKWVKPDFIGGITILKGNYEPVVLLITPKLKQMLTFENQFQATENLLLKTDIAFSKQNVNTFSDINNSNNYGLGSKFEIVYKKKLSSSKNTMALTSGGFVDFTSIHFNPIEKFRAIEFNRNWNLGNKIIQTPLLIGNINLGIINGEETKVQYNLDVLDLTNEYRGVKNRLFATHKNEKIFLEYKGNFLYSSSEETTNFYRHKSKIESSVSGIVVGYEDETENNVFSKNDSLLSSSYAFYSGKVYVKNKPKKQNEYRFFYGFRQEKTEKDNQLSASAISHDAGIDYGLNSNNKLTQLRGNVTYRKLIPADTSSGLKPENTFLNQLNFSTSVLKQLFRFHTFYNIGSGLEQKKEFIYVEVNPGQGVFAWIDYNENGSKELNEFEIAAFQDQANYIRILTQSNKYIRTFSNQFSQSISISPRVLLKDEKDGLLKFISKISSVSAFKIDRKTNQESIESSLNPFTNSLSDTNLVSLNKHFRSSLFFNRTGYKYSVELNYQNISNKALLSNGFDSRLNEAYGVNLRYKIKQILLKVENETGVKSLESDFLSSRNYKLSYWKTSPVISYQKGTNFILDFIYSYQEKTNQLEGEYASLSTFGSSLKYTLATSLNLSASVNFVSIGYQGTENSSLEYELLEGLKRGNNFTWEILLNKRIAKNLDLTLNYNGRKPENIKTIHSGTIQIRAFF